MKRILIVAVIIAYSINCLSQFEKLHCYSELKYAGGYNNCEQFDDWVLVFNDEFNGTDVDYTVWNNQSPNGRNAYCDGRNFEYNTDGDNFEVSNGILKLIAKDEDITAPIADWLDPYDTLTCDGEPWDLNTQTFDYTSGNVWTKQQFSHGLFEIKCKIPPIKKMWPAFWLYDHCGQEIDVFEFLSSADVPLANKVMTFTYHRQINCTGKALQCSKEITSSEDMSQAMHVYSVEWTDRYILWRVDGDPLVIKYKWYDSLGRYVDDICDYPYYLYALDLIYPLGDHPMWVSAGLGVREDPTATFPTEMEIDYIRIFQRINTSQSITICSNSDIIGSTVAGDEIYVGGTNCNITVASGEFLSLVANNQIVIDSNFEVEIGATFRMAIDQGVNPDIN